MIDLMPSRRKIPDAGEVQKIRSSLEQVRNGSVGWDSDPVFASTVRGKRVVIVGPARTLLGKRLGRYIDSFDLVVRLNDCFHYLPVSDREDLGSRTDILYCNQVILRKEIIEQRPAIQEDLFALFQREGIRTIVCTNNSLDYDSAGRPMAKNTGNDKTIIRDLAELVHARSEGLHVRVVSEASRLLIRLLNGNWPRTGFVAMVDLMGFHVSDLFLTGMTFYHGGGHLGLPEGAELHPLKNRDGSSSIAQSGFGHDSSLELGIARVLANVFHPVLQTDDELKKLLGLLTTDDSA